MRREWGHRAGGAVVCCALLLAPMTAQADDTGLYFKAAKPVSDADPLWVMGQVCTLMAVSPGHKHLALADLEWLVMPAISSRQFRLFRANGQPIGFISWAFLDDEAEQRLRRPRPYLRPADWRSGPKCWLVDIVAPFGHAEAILTELRERVLIGIDIHTFNGPLGATGGDAQDTVVTPARAN